MKAPRFGFLPSGGFYAIFRMGVPGERDAIGFVIKWREPLLFSERYDYYRRAFKLGRFYFRTYAKRAA